MDQVRKAGAVAAGALAALVLVAGVPLVPYSVSFSMYSSSAYPPTQVTGYSTPLFALTGLGLGPYQPVMLIPQGNSSAVVHFEGARIAYWEGPFPADTVLDQGNEVKVTNASITQLAFGLLNFTARLTNIESRPILNLSVIFHYPSYGRNQSVGGFTRSYAPAAPCSPLLSPSESCVASVSLPQSSSLLTDEYYPMTVEAWSRGAPANEVGFAGPFVHVYTADLRYPGAGLGSRWVQTFIRTVNQERNATALTENRTLDEFAAFRYDSIRSEYQISDYNFTSDYSRFFGTSGPSLFEEILYPAGKSPTTFPDYLRQYAPGHWAGLMNPTYTEYGYFFGTGPAVEVGPGCSATEIPGPNINITQYVISHGCSYVIADEIWFILILGA